MRLGDCVRHIEDTLGGTPDRVTLAEIANHAGQWLTTIQGWKFLERQSTTLDFVSGQSYVELPANLITLTEVQRTNSLSFWMEPTSLARILQLRTSGVGASNVHYYAVGHRLDTNSIPRPILELWPTPGAGSGGELTIDYRAGWAMLFDDSDIVQIPPMIEPLYTETVRAVAKGYDEDDGGNVSERLAAVRGGVLFEAARRQDVTVQSQYGAIEGGITENLTYGHGIHWRDRPVNDPS
jgi:hypothetical protein